MLRLSPFCREDNKASLQVGPLTQLRSLEVESHPRQLGFISILFTRAHTVSQPHTHTLRKTYRQWEINANVPVMDSCILGMGDRVNTWGVGRHGVATSQLKKTGCKTKLSMLLRLIQKNYEEKERLKEMSRFHCSGHLHNFLLHHRLSFLPLPACVFRSALPDTVLFHTAHSRHSTIFSSTWLL